jgi:hypothetical protein
MAGRPPTYLSDAEKPVSVSLRIPRELYDQAQQYVRMRRMTLTELLIEGLRLSLETPADPRELVLSNDSNTVMQHIQELVNAAVQAALATGYPPTHTVPRAAAPVPSTDIQHDDNITVIQERVAAVHQAAPLLQKKRGRPGTMRAQILALLRDYPDGLTALEMKVYLGAEKAFGDTLQGMVRQHRLEKKGSGNAVRYLARGVQQ